MPNSLRVKLSKLRFQGKITQEEYKELIEKLEGHDEVLVAQIKGQTKWIPVSEPPKKNGEYLVTLVDEDSNGDSIFVVDKAYWTGMNWTYKFDFALFNGGEYCIKPIAYMPLPEPYKAESEDEE